jgi:hypothetical protein
LLELRYQKAQGWNIVGTSDSPKSTYSLFGQSAIRASLGSAKILVSPLDPDKQGANDGIDLPKRPTGYLFTSPEAPSATP